MQKINRLWYKRYEYIEELEVKQVVPFSEKIDIAYYLAKDLLLKQNVILKEIKINEEPEIKDLARYLWHYEISLNQRATNKSRGKTLLKLVDAQIDDEDDTFILVTESGGSSLRTLILAEEENEDTISFNNFRNTNKKTIWEAILQLVQGLYSLHTSGLIHRNISIDSIYFDGEAYRQGEKNVLKLGDFNWSIYLNSISNIFENQITAEVIKDNYHFFRAPECLPFYIDEDLSDQGETHQSDLFSFGLVLIFLLESFEYKKFFCTKIEDRAVRYEEIRKIIKNFKGRPLEREILLKLVEVDPQNRFSNVGELLEKIAQLVNMLKYDFMELGKLPVYFKLDRNSPFLRQVANNINYSIDAILLDPDEFLSREFENNILFLTNNQEFPLWTKGKSGSYYKFKKAFRRSNLAQINNFNPRIERNLELSNIEICKIPEFYWLDLAASIPYLSWEETFVNAFAQIRERKLELSQEMLIRGRWLKSLKLIQDAEEEIEKMGIYEYEIISDSEDDEHWDDKNIRKLNINIYHKGNKNIFTELISEAQNYDVELLDTNFLFEYFKVKRKWVITNILEETYEFTTVELKGKRNNEEPHPSGYIRLWDLRFSIFLLKRKRLIIQSLEENENLLDAILQPASTHKYFLKYDKNKLVEFIFYTNPIFLLQGPPGTGKTWTAKELIKLTLEKDPYSRILVASKEHSALDDLLLKCVNMLKGSKVTPQPSLIRLISPDRELSYSPASTPYSFFLTQVTKNIIKNITNWKPKDKELMEIHREFISSLKHVIQSPSREWLELIRESSNIVFCTTTARDLRELEYSSIAYDLVIIEEAGKTYPSELFKPMQLGNKWVLIGDQNQLPPFRIEDIIEIIEDLLLNLEEDEQEKPDYDPREFQVFKNEVKNEIKIFQSMFNKFQKIKHSFDDSDEIKSCDTLLDQYRLPSVISKMISSIFYNEIFNQMIEDPKDFVITPSKFRNQQLIWINTTSKKEFKEKRTGVNLYNISEVDIILKLLNSIRISEDQQPFSLAILSPYKEQVELLKKMLPNNLEHLGDLKIKESCFTIDSFQGQEADLVIISLVRNNNYESSRKAWGFVPLVERLNVMLSRAKKTEIIVGNWDMCILHKGDQYMRTFSKVAKFFQKEGLLIDYDEAL
jgi:serine/threonine protein kinase